jgi:YVTN family beta-propeller protein
VSGGVYFASRERCNAASLAHLSSAGPLFRLREQTSSEPAATKRLAVLTKPFSFRREELLKPTCLTISKGLVIMDDVFVPERFLIAFHRRISWLHPSLTLRRLPPLTLATIDTATNKGLASLELELGSFDEGEFLIGMAVTPDGKHLYLANPISRKVSVIDTATNSVSTEVDVGGAPVNIAIFA